jgi:hypothetical protein
MARRYGRCCMYGPNYVKLSRAIAVRLFSMSIPHYTALPPPDPAPLGPAVQPPCHHRLHSPRPHPGTTTPARCSRLEPRQWQPRHVQTICTRVPKRCAHPRRLCRYTSSRLPTGIGCGTLALAPRTYTHNTTTLATQTPSRPPNYRHTSNVDACQ